MTIEERILEIERHLEDMKRQSQAALALATACVETLERVREPRLSWGGSSSLEQRATTEESSAPALAPAAPPLWEVMDRVFYDNGGQDHDDWVATINAVADWLAAREHCGAASALRSEARRAREGA